VTQEKDPFADVDAEQGRRAEPTTFADKVRRVEASWLNTPPPPRAWLVSYQDDVDGDGDAERKRRKRGFIARGEMHLLVGEGGVGKGHVVCQLATALAAAAPLRLDGEALGGSFPFPSVLGFDVHSLQDDEKILLLVGEDDEHEMHARIYAAARAEKLSDQGAARVAERVRWRSYRGTSDHLIDLSDDQTAKHSDEMVELLRYIDEEGPFALVVVDPYSRFIAIEENANTLQHQAAAALEAITTTRGRPAVLLVGHVGKPDKDERRGARTMSQHDARGASAVVNAVRVCHAMAPAKDDVVVDRNGRTSTEEGFDASTGRKVTENAVRLACVKNNLGPKGHEKTLAWTADGGLLVESDKARTERRRLQWRGGIPVPPKSSRTKNDVLDDDGGRA